MGCVFGGPAALCFVNQFVRPNAIALDCLFGRRVFSFVSGCISEIVAGFVLDWYILIREHVRFLCLSQSPRLYGTSISEKTRRKSNQSRFAKTC